MRAGALPCSADPLCRPRPEHLPAAALSSKNWVMRAQALHALQYIDYREPSFLQHPLVPRHMLWDRETVYLYPPGAAQTVRYGSGVNVEAGPALTDERMHAAVAHLQERSILHVENLEPHSFAGFALRQVLEPPLLRVTPLLCTLARSALCRPFPHTMLHTATRPADQLARSSCIFVALRAGPRWCLLDVGQLETAMAMLALPSMHQTHHHCIESNAKLNHETHAQGSASVFTADASGAYATAVSSSSLTTSSGCRILRIASSVCQLSWPREVVMQENEAFEKFHGRMRWEQKWCCMTENTEQREAGHQHIFYIQPSPLTGPIDYPWRIPAYNLPEFCEEGHDKQLTRGVEPTHKEIWDSPEHPCNYFRQGWVAKFTGLWNVSLTGPASA
jgi:hypothetical protein